MSTSYSHKNSFHYFKDYLMMKLTLESKAIDQLCYVVCRVQTLVYIFGAQPKFFGSPKFIPHTHLPVHIP